MYKFNLKTVKQFWAIAKLYWFSDEKQRALGLLLLLGVLLLANTKLTVLLYEIQGDSISALSARDVTRFWQSVLIGLGGIILLGLGKSGYEYMQDIIGLYWRRWLTNHFLARYLRDRAFYDLHNFHPEIDNPDQRISEDIASFCQQSVQYLSNLIESIVVVITISAVLWAISKNLVFCLIIYSILAYGITIGFYGRKLTKLNLEQLKKQANFRFGLVRVRENAESIAFYNGIHQENAKLKYLFNEVFHNFKRLILWADVYFNFFKNPFGNLTWILPSVILAPQILAGKLEVGKVVEAGGALGTVAFSVNVIMFQFKTFTQFAASINRLYVFYQYLNQPLKEISNGRNIDIVEDNRLAVEDLTLQIPNSQKTLFTKLSVALQPGQGLLIMGESGCGKSSLLRALAGLWDSGTGVIFRPNLGEMLFLPQRPYMILGTLREQLIYPHASVDMSDEELLQVLHKVNLSDLVERFGGLEVEGDWSSLLSQGEQQRLTFARILVTKPKYVILDEATSALDTHNEEQLYQMLLETQITFISVGHRPTLKKYHHIFITL